MAIVVDEYGGTAGPRDRRGPARGDRRRDPRRVRRRERDGRPTKATARSCSAARSASTRSRDRLGVEIEREGFETLGGYLLSHLGRMPYVGETFEVDDLAVEVLEVERRRITKVRVRRRAGRGVGGVMAIHPQVRIGHVHLKVADLDRALALLLRRARLRAEAALRSGRGVHFRGRLSPSHRTEHVGEPAAGRHRRPGTTGLYHTAILYPTRAELGDALRRVIDAGIPLDGAADHGVSEALYLRDPDEQRRRAVPGIGRKRRGRERRDGALCDVHAPAATSTIARCARRTLAVTAEGRQLAQARDDLA